MLCEKPACAAWAMLSSCFCRGLDRPGFHCQLQSCGVRKIWWHQHYVPPVKTGLHCVQNEMKYSAAVAPFDLSHFLGIEFHLNFNLSPDVSQLFSQQADRYLLCMEIHPTSGWTEQELLLLLHICSWHHCRWRSRGGQHPTHLDEFGMLQTSLLFACSQGIHTEFLSHN